MHHIPSVQALRLWQGIPMVGLYGRFGCLEDGTFAQCFADSF